MPLFYRALPFFHKNIHLYYYNFNSTDPLEAKAVCNNEFHHILIYFVTERYFYDLKGQLE